MVVKKKRTTAKDLKRELNKKRAKDGKKALSETIRKIPLTMEQAKDKYRSFNEDTWADLVSELKEGMPITRACSKVGICYTTLQRWLEAGKLQEENNINGIMGDFYVDVEKAQSIRMKRLLLYCDPENNPRIALDLLTKQFPNEFGNKQVIEHEGNVPVDTENMGERLERLSKIREVREVKESESRIEPEVEVEEESKEE